MLRVCVVICKLKVCYEFVLLFFYSEYILNKIIDL